LAGIISAALEASAGAPNQRVYVYKDYNAPENKAVAANIMPARAAEINMVGLKTFYQPGHDSKGSSIQLTFDVNPPPTWAGVVFPVQRDYWGEWAAVGLDLSKATKLVFWARGELGGEQIQVKAAIAGDKPYGDSAAFPVATSWLALEKGWRKYEVPVDGAQLSRVITPFAVITSKPYNPTGKVTVYLDEIYYEISN